MNQRFITLTHLNAFRDYLKREEKSANTIEKYMRDVRAFLSYVQDKEIMKETVIAYKQKLINENYAIRSINSMIASINSLLAFLNWEDCKVKSIKLQRQIYCPEEKNLLKRSTYALPPPLSKKEMND